VAEDLVVLASRSGVALVCFVGHRPVAVSLVGNLCYCIYDVLYALYNSTKAVKDIPSTLFSEVEEKIRG
jgi:hypothetical protein